MDKTDRLRDYGLAFLLYEQGLGVCGYELIRELFIFVKLILNSYLILELLALYILYLVNENFILSPKSCVVVGYELDDSNGVLVCLS